MSVSSPRPSGSSDRPQRDPRAGEAGGLLAQADGTHGHPLVNTANPQTQQGPAPWPRSARAGGGPAVGAEELRAEHEAAGGLRAQERRTGQRGSLSLLTSPGRLGAGSLVGLTQEETSQGRHLGQQTLSWSRGGHSRSRAGWTHNPRTRSPSAWLLRLWGRYPCPSAVQSCVVARSQLSGAPASSGDPGPSVAAVPPCPHLLCTDAQPAHSGF